MAYTAKDLKHFLSSELKPEDTFQFECKMCGSCCRNRKEPILITGADIYMIAKTLGISMGEVIAKNCSYYLGPSSHVPIIVLKERLDGSCSLLRNGKCMVQSGKPTACALYPLGRLYNPKDNSFHYFINGQTCQTPGSGKMWTLQEWLDNFHIKESERLTVAWDKLLMGLAEAMVNIKRENISRELIDFLFAVLYLGYDTEKPYEAQVEERIPMVKRILKREFNIKVDFG